jgi:hypothetical protein
MLKTTALFIYAIVSMVSFSAYSNEETQENLVTCKECACGCEEQGKDKPMHWC